MKGSVDLIKELTHSGCVSQDSYPRKSILRKEGKLGSNRAVTFSKGTRNHTNSGEKVSIARSWPGGWSHQGVTATGGGRLVRVPNLRVCEHVAMGWQRPAVVPSCWRG